ncbi:GNAT family acetyltransferase [Brevundimonas sp. AAP58]|uniref:GNAT family N-acetyltransferase n=1 Tax=Brevundimonas sp. AAP58 TaxID=1523422 RepID=UPI0006B8C27C|nr:N-acetyltransferase [Brevundimonas sp. AAP58]KPF83800.1 GNAT family acetyltransferase [Brevundimonas sp. AAP58]
MPASAAPLPAVRIAPETPDDADAVEALVLDAFGSGRFAKTAERLRERARKVAGFSAWLDGRLVGSVRLWAVTIGEADALFLGPIAVARDIRGEGLGADLVAACVDEARRQGVAGVLLVGDAPYFSRFGFGMAESAVMPGPADPRRVLWLPIRHAEAAGPVRPA